MRFVHRAGQVPRRANAAPSWLPMLATAGVVAVTACAHSMASSGDTSPSPKADMSLSPPNPDPRIGLKAGVWDAGQAAWNMDLISNTRPSEQFINKGNSDLAFIGNYVIQGGFNGVQIWDISDPAHVTLKTAYVCPASQSDVSVYKNLMFVSAEAPTARIDCGAAGVKDTVSPERLRGLRIVDISDIEHPKTVATVQTCRGSHTHTLVVDPKDPDNVYVYISGSSFVRSPNEMAGCVSADPDQDPNSSKFRIEVIKVPLAHPEQSAIVSSAHIFNGLGATQMHAETPVERDAAAAARAKGEFTARVIWDEEVMPSKMVDPLLDSLVKARGGTGAPTAADSDKLRGVLQEIVDDRYRAMMPGILPNGGGITTTSCHDITVYPQIGLAGGACEGYGMLLDISDPEHPQRIDAVSDSNFSYWHSATFSNDGTKILFSDEWGGGGQPKCRATDPKNWGADAIFAIENRKMVFQSYYKLPAPMSPLENCVAHNGSLIPIPGRDVMAQAWYQGGVSVFDWTDAKHPHEIAFFDRGPMDSTHFSGGGYWSAYWYNGHIIGSEIRRGLDILDLKPSAWLSQNEIDAAKSVHFTEFNTQGQPQLVWPASFVLARAYVDQLERSNGLSGSRIAAVRKTLESAEKASGSDRQSTLTQLATQLDSEAQGSSDAAKVRTLAGTVRDLAKS